VRRGGVHALASVVVFLASNAALANGRFPAAGLVAFDPRDDAHFAVRTTFGVLESRDGGKSFDFACESALKLGVEEDPMLAFTALGPLVVATFGGMLTSDDGCSYRYVPELEGQIVLDLARSASAPDSLVAFRLLGLGGGLYQSGLLRSDDAGASWTVLPPFPEVLLPMTVDVAAREPSRVYLTARRGADDGYDSVLMVSDDGGETFRTHGIPDTDGQRLAYVSGVHPSDPERLVVRVNDPDGTVLLETRDAGETFERLFSASGLLTGFTFSPDGSEMAFGGRDDGLWVGSSEEGDYERRSDVGPTCLAWSRDGLYACADAQTASFSFGRSSDAGRSFETLLVFAELCGRSSCGGETDVGMLCPIDWTNVAPLLGSTCNVDAGEAPDGGEASPGISRVPRARGGCSMTVSSSRSGSREPSWAVAMVLFVTVGRWRRARAFGRGFFRSRRGSPSTC
jgi:hypothetical protein